MRKLCLLILSFTLLGSAHAELSDFEIKTRYCEALANDSIADPIQDVLGSWVPQGFETSSLDNSGLKQKWDALFTTTSAQLPNLAWHRLHFWTGSLAHPIAAQALYGQVIAGFISEFSYSWSQSQAPAKKDLFLAHPPGNKDFFFWGRIVDAEYLGEMQNYWNNSMGSFLLTVQLGESGEERKIVFIDSRPGGTTNSDVYILGAQKSFEETIRETLTRAQLPEVFSQIMGRPFNREDRILLESIFELYAFLPATSGQTAVLKQLRGQKTSAKHETIYGALKGDKSYSNDQLKFMIDKVDRFLERIGDMSSQELGGEAPRWILRRDLSNVAQVSKQVKKLYWELYPDLRD